METKIHYKTGPPRSIVRHIHNLRCRTKHWHTESNWHWSLVFTDAYNLTMPHWARVDVFGNQNIHVLNAIRAERITACNGPNGPNE